MHRAGNLYLWVDTPHKEKLGVGRLLAPVRLEICLQVTKSSHLLGDEVFLCIMVCAVMTPLHLQRGPIITSAVDPSSLITLFHPCSTSRLNISDPGQLPLDHQCLCVLPLYTHSLGSTMVWVSKIFFQCRIDYFWPWNIQAPTLNDDLTL